jgi:hypothetical protein
MSALVVRYLLAMVSRASDMDRDLDLVNSGIVVDYLKLRCRFEEWVLKASVHRTEKHTAVWLL